MTTQLPASPYAWPHNATLSPTTTALIIIDMQRDFLSVGGYLDTISPSPSTSSTTGTSTPPSTSITRFQPLIPRIVSLLTTFRRAGFPIFHTREGHAAHLCSVTSREMHRSGVAGGKIGSRVGLQGSRLLIRGERGHDIVSELQPLREEPIIDKPGRSAFWGTDLEALLRAKGIANLVVCGVTADACVSSTVRDASDRGYDVLVVEDGVESVSEELKKWSLESIRIEGGLFGVTADCRTVKEAVESWMNGSPKGLGRRRGQSSATTTEPRWYHEKKDLSREPARGQSRQQSPAPAQSTS